MQEEIKTNQDELENHRTISEARFWLNLREQLGNYDDVESYFRIGGKWFGGTMILGPGTPEEWSKVKSYMSLLSLLNAMIDRGIISEEMFHRLYGTRINFIYYNQVMRREILEKEGYHWRDFLHLCLRRGLDKSKYYPGRPSGLLQS